jgi:hypothetical protein
VTLHEAGPGATVTYLTDVEGMWTKLASFARANPSVALDDAGRLRVAPGAIFVYGGDAIDRGPHGRRVVATLLEAKQRQPDQVVLLAGNRDINKLRLPRELGGHPPPRTPDEVRTGPRPALLRWIFQHTMGAPAAFEHRRTEVAHERTAAGAAEVSDDEVVEGYLADLAPGGPLRAYLAACQLAFRAGRTLFVHGGLSATSLGHVPGRSEPLATAGALEVDVDAWIASLNGWYAEQLDAFVAQRHHADGTPAWQPLIAYQAPAPGSRLNPGSVVYGRSVDDHNNLVLPGPEVIAALARAGLDRAVVGHTPSGDSPSLGRRGAFQMLCADNSHARHDQGSRVWLDDHALRIDAATRLDGDAADAPLRRVQVTLTSDDDASPLGLRTRSHGRLVRGVLEGGTLLTYRALPEWKTEQLAAPPDSLPRDALEPPT